MREDMFHACDHEKEELSLYSRAMIGLESRLPFGWGELWDIVDRTNYNLSRH